eukprot:2498906-Prymnesium_polylepis.1
MLHASWRVAAPLRRRQKALLCKLLCRGDLGQREVNTGACKDRRNLLVARARQNAAHAQKTSCSQLADQLGAKEGWLILGPQVLVDDRDVCRSDLTRHLAPRLQLQIQPPEGDVNKRDLLSACRAEGPREMTQALCIHKVLKNHLEQVAHRI